MNLIPANPGHFPPWSTHYKALQAAHTGELQENRRESEPYSRESQALSPYGPHTTRHYRWPTQGNYRKTAGKVNHILTNPGHFPLWPTHYKALQVTYTGEPQENHRESEPNPHESRALSPLGHIPLPRLHSSTKATLPTPNPAPKKK